MPLSLAPLCKCGTVTGRYVSQSHPRLNSIKESTKTYGSGASDMIRVLCAMTLLPWFIPSLIWSLTETGLQAETSEPQRAPWGGLLSYRGYECLPQTNLLQSTGHIVKVETDCSHRTIKNQTSVYFSDNQNSDMLRLKGAGKFLQPKSHAAILAFIRDNAGKQLYPRPSSPTLAPSCHKRQVICLSGQGCFEGMRVQVFCCLWRLWRKAERTSWSCLIKALTGPDYMSQPGGGVCVSFLRWRKSIWWERRGRACRRQFLYGRQHTPCQADTTTTTPSPPHC